ncbi:MAG: methionyl-tRNA formyltransferase [Thiotrichaceae bacterium]|nr:methionyl-tRNA formyltransferase [Thiotrichaceae bacterium]
MTLKIIYAGTPDFAVPALQSLIDSSHDVCAVYTQPDRPAGRGRKITFGAVKQLAVDNDIIVQQPLSLRDENAQQILKAYQADLMVVAAYGLILPLAVLAMPRYGCLNIHGSLLPRWRGAAPIQRAIQSGDSMTGNTIMQMAEGLDTGDILLQSQCPIEKDDTSQTIHDKLAHQGAIDLMQTIDQLLVGKLTPQVQDESLACYAHKMTKQEAIIDWSQSANEIDRLVHAFNPWPVAVTQFNGKSLKVLMSSVLDQSHCAEVGAVIAESAEGIDVATGDGVLRIQHLQIAGKKAMLSKDFLNGHSLLDSILRS